MEIIKYLGYEYPNANSTKKRPFAIYKCPYCGIHFRANQESVKRGHHKSCGCMKNKLISLSRTKHGLYGCKLYQLWLSIKHRCNYIHDDHYGEYGGRGIFVCEEWDKDFMSFYKWAINNQFQNGLVIDRINNDGNYEPSNCRFITRSQSAQNTRLLKKGNKSGYRCVWFVSKTGKWKSVITHQHKMYHLGYFNSPQDAALAYNNFVIQNKTNHPLNPI